MPSQQAEIEAARAPFSKWTKARLVLEIAATFPRARLAAQSDDDIRAALARLRGTTEVQGDLPPGPDATTQILLGQHLGRAVARTMRYLPGDTRCLTQSLVLITMLSHRSIPSTLVLGVSPDGGFSAHAWVELNGIPLLPAREDVFRRLVEL